MQLGELLNANGYENITGKMTTGIQQMDLGNCTSIRPIPNDLCKLFEGVEIYNENDDGKMFIINFDYYTKGNDEFAPAYTDYYAHNGYLITEVHYDENGEESYVNDLSEVV